MAFRLTALASSVALFTALSANVALADIHEPNGLAVPQPAPSNEISLSTYFQSVGEMIDATTDAGTQPSTFSPLCGFKATFVLNQAGSHFGIAWYNATGAKPAPSDLHTIIPANTPVGTVVTSADIKNDPAYLGGLIGFALVGGETHYSESQWDNVCTGCNPAAPWITALMYASKKFPNAYYIGFEDGGTGATSWNNDGDFNDDVFLVEGVVCSGGGDACDTGLPGICGPGVTQCTPNGIVCEGVSSMTNETCNGLDDNCDGTVDEGNLCNPGEVCDHGKCVSGCGTEFPCPSGKVCNASGYCVEADCVTANCMTGQICVGGKCQAPCDNVTCPFPDVCRNGGCVDPCAGVMCDAQTQVCDKGVCIPKCSCLPCDSGKTCDMTEHCIDSMCIGVNCMADEHCVGGSCINDCDGAVCPHGDICQMGACVPDPNMGQGGAGGGSTGALNPATTTGSLSSGSTTTTGSSMSTSTSMGSTSASTGASMTGGAGGTINAKGGCGCSVESASPADAVPWAALALAGTLGARARRRSRRRSRTRQSS